MRRNDSAHQKYKPPVQTLCTFGSGSGAAVTVAFRVPVPDSRLRVKISIMFIPVAGNYPLTGIASAGTLWLSEAEDDDSGVQGGTIPCTNIEGTSAAPTSIPAANGLLGYSREFVSAGDNIQGVFNVTPGGPMVGSWVLQTRYQPEGVRFTPEEWNEIVPQCNPNLTTPPVTRP